MPKQLDIVAAARAHAALLGAEVTEIGGHPVADVLAALDAFEGEEYRRGSVQAMTEAGPVAAEVYWPSMPVAPSAAVWTLDRWMREHKPQVIARETELARAARAGTARR